jgi:hypothetical protein
MPKDGRRWLSTACPPWRKKAGDSNMLLGGGIFAVVQLDWSTPPMSAQEAGGEGEKPSDEFLGLIMMRH